LIIVEFNVWHIFTYRGGGIRFGGFTHAKWKAEKTLASRIL
jgi:hypothetical protein